MTTPQVDQELERLFTVARAATAPPSGARERIRAGLAPQLAASSPAPARGRVRRHWLGVGVTVLGVSGALLWLARAPQTAHVGVPVATPAPAREPAPATAPVAPAAPATAPTSAGSAPELAPRAAPASAPATPPPAKPALAASSDADPAEELALVRSMQQALRASNPQQALALAADHTRRFPRGNLVEEREGVRAVAQCQLATADARPRILDTFARRFATSPYTARVKAACQ